MSHIKFEHLSRGRNKVPKFVQTRCDSLHQQLIFPTSVPQIKIVSASPAGVFPESQPSPLSPINSCFELNCLLINNSFSFCWFRSGCRWNIKFCFAWEECSSAWAAAPWGNEKGVQYIVYYLQSIACTNFWIAVIGI